MDRLRSLAGVVRSVLFAGFPDVAGRLAPTMLVRLSTLPPCRGSSGGPGGWGAGAPKEGPPSAHVCGAMGVNSTGWALRDATKEGRRHRRWPGGGLAGRGAGAAGTAGAAQKNGSDLGQGEAWPGFEQRRRRTFTGRSLRRPAGGGIQSGPPASWRGGLAWPKTAKPPTVAGGLALPSGGQTVSTSVGSQTSATVATLVIMLASTRASISRTSPVVTRGNGASHSGRLRGLLLTGARVLMPTP